MVQFTNNKLLSNTRLVRTQNLKVTILFLASILVNIAGHNLVIIYYCISLIIFMNETAEHVTLFSL
jgi:hypothetical protein